MNRDPRNRLPLAGLLIIFVAPLATLMIMVPGLFAGSVQKVETAVPAIINRLIPNPSPHLRTPGLSPQPPVAVASGKPAPKPAPRTPAGAVATSPAATPPPPPVVSTPSQPVTTATATNQSNKGRRRRRRPNQNQNG